MFAAPNKLLDPRWHPCRLPFPNDAAFFHATKCVTYTLERKTYPNPGERAPLA